MEIIVQSTKSEAEEEAITLKVSRIRSSIQFQLMKRMNKLKKEKEALMKQVDIEEDHITNKLLKKLDEVGIMFCLTWIVTERENIIRTKIGI